MNSCNDIQNIYYINLDTRPDRKHHFENQMKILDWNAKRYSAIKHQMGALGCSMSHLSLLQFAKNNNLEHILIMEDDIKFLDPELFKSQLNLFLSNHKSWDVILVGGNNIPPYRKIDDTCVKVTNCHTTTGYLVNAHYFDILIENFTNGINNLIKSPEQHTLYAIDQFWTQLQKRDNWFLIIPLTVTQRTDYSDIEKRPTNYTPVMIDLDKDNYFRIKKESIIKEQSRPKLNINNF